MPLYNPPASSGITVDWQRDGQAGILAPSFRCEYATSAVTADRALYARCVPVANITATKIRFVVVNTGSGNVDVAIYDSSLNRLVSSGYTAGKKGTAGPVTVDVAATALTAGTVYYIGWVTDSTTGTVVVADMPDVYRFWGNSVPQAHGFFKDMGAGVGHPATQTISFTTTQPCLLGVEA